MAVLQAIVADPDQSMYSTAGTSYPVRANNGDIYIVYSDRGAATIKYIKSTDDGASWVAPVTLASGDTFVQLSVWFDRWSNIAAGLIHVAYTGLTSDDTLYRNINTENSDTLSSVTTIFAGVTAGVSGNAMSIVRARGGNLYCKTTIDAGVEGGFFRSTDVGATWGARTNSEALATQDQWILMPGWAADTQDIMMFFWDASADEISRVLYDDSGDSWSETSIATSMVDLVATGGFPNFSAAVDIANSRNLLVAWSASDTANADLRCWHITESAITEVTNVVLNSTDDQFLCAVGIDTNTGNWWCFYTGLSGGSETVGSTVGVYYKVSANDGVTWGSETLWGISRIGNAFSLSACHRFATDPLLLSYVSNGSLLLGINVQAPAGGGRAMLVNEGSLVG